MMVKSLVIIVLGLLSGPATMATDYLIYSYNPEGKNALYKQNLETGKIIRLSDPSYNVWTASSAPNGQWLAFSSDETGTDEIYRMNFDGSERIRLTVDAEQNYHPSISPDGTQIAYSRESVGEIILMDADGANKKIIASHEEDNVHPVFSPDGQKLMFFSRRVKNEVNAPGIFTVDLSNGEIEHTGFYGYHPRYAPSGKKISFAAPAVKGGLRKIFVAYLGDEGQLTQVTNDDLEHNQPAFTPDGKQVYFVSSKNARNGDLPNEVFRADIDGHNVVHVTTKGAVAWHPEVFAASN